MQGPFEQFIQDLGRALGLPLHVDDKNSCTLLVEEKLTLQIEPDHQEESLLVGSTIIELSPGKFREEVLKEALKENHIYPRLGTLAYSIYNNHLALFQRFPTWQEIPLEVWIDWLSAFIAKAIEWRQSIEEGRSSPPPVSDKGGPPPFSLKP